MVVPTEVVPKDDAAELGWRDPAAELGRSAQIAANVDSWNKLSSETHLYRNHPTVLADWDAWRSATRELERFQWLPELLQGEPRLVRMQDEVELEFARLADEWERETTVISSPVELAIHPAYQRIIGLGMQAVPLLLQRLLDTKRYWFWALAAITGENPALGLGVVDDAVDAWLAWGRTRGLITK